MAVCAVHTGIKKAVALRYVTISGTVKKATVGIARNIIVYKNDNSEIIAASGTSSAIDGTFSINVAIGSNDFIRVICIGETDENSEIFEDVVEV